MAAATLIKPDTEFIRSVLANGGGDLKKCFQCATCSTVCELAPEDSPFPRKQMIEAQWGLKAELLKDPAVWLCHNCGQCTTYCPRGARPGDVMGALRREAIRAAAFPRFLAGMVANARMWPVLFLLPTLIFTAILLWAPKEPPVHEWEFANAFPIPVLEILFFALSAFVVVSFVVSLRRFVGIVQTPGAGGVWLGLLPALALIARHERFAQCGRDRLRYWGHFLTMWGFVGLALMGTMVGIGTMTGVMRTPLPLLSFWKIFANVCAAGILAGVVLLLWRRVADPGTRAASSYFDWFLVLTLGGVVATGLVSQGLRLAETPAMYPVYFVHLVLIFALLAYAPYSKFAHFAYRTVAIAAEKGAEKRPPPAPVLPPEPVCKICGIRAAPEDGQTECRE